MKLEVTTQYITYLGTSSTYCVVGNVQPSNFQGYYTVHMYVPGFDHQMLAWVIVTCAISHTTSTSSILLIYSRALYPPALESRYALRCIYVTTSCPQVYTCSISQEEASPRGGLRVVPYTLASGYLLACLTTFGANLRKYYYGSTTRRHKYSPP